jgi:tetratricopeptide (TPR) repeat protein
MVITTAVWRFARGVAYAATGKMKEAESERQAFMDIKNALPADAMYGPLNTVSNVFKIAENVLDAKIALARQDRKAAIALLKKAVEAEDVLNYTEPPDWYPPVRESLGGVLFLNGDFAEAEKVFRADLEKNPRNGRSLFGLQQSLKAQGKTYEARLVQREFEAAWKRADTLLKPGDL